MYEYLLYKADALVSEGYFGAGYDTVVIDDICMSPLRDPITGRFVPEPHRFPNGIRELADYVRKFTSFIQ